MANHFAAMETDGGAGHPIGVNIKGNPEVKKILAPVANILQESGAGILDLVEHCGADIEPLRKPACRVLVRFKTAVSTSTIITPLPTRSTKLCRKNWRKIPQWWRWSRMRCEHGKAITSLSTLLAHHRRGFILSLGQRPRK